MKRSSVEGGVGRVWLRDDAATEYQLRKLKELDIPVSGPLSYAAARDMIRVVSAKLTDEQKKKIPARLDEKDGRALEELKIAGLAPGSVFKTRQHPGPHRVESTQDDPPRVICTNPRGKISALRPQFILKETVERPGASREFKTQKDLPGHHALSLKYCTRCGGKMLRSDYPDLNDRKWSSELVCDPCVRKPSWESFDVNQPFCEKCGKKHNTASKTAWCIECTDQ